MINRMKKGFKMYRKLLNISIVLLIATAGITAQTTTINRMIDKAQNEYTAGNTSVAISGLENALALMKQKWSSSLTKLLPRPLPGWTARPASASGIDPTGTIKGFSAEQKYQRGESTVTATLLINSNITDGLKPFFDNPAKAMNSGGNIENIGNRKAFVRYYEDRRQGEISVLSGKQTVAVVHGYKVSLRDLRNFAKGFNYAGISTLK